MQEDEVAWTATPYRAPVMDRNGQQFATTESLLGDEGADIFHGLAVSLQHGGRTVTLQPDQVTKITRDHVETSVDTEHADELPDYEHEHWFHLGWGGLFRNRPEWKEDG